MSYRRPVLRPVTWSSRTEESTTPCSGEFSNTRSTGLLILIRASGGTFRSTALVIATTSSATTLQGLHPSCQRRWSLAAALAPGVAVPVHDQDAGVVGAAHRPDVVAGDGGGAEQDVE